MQSEFEKVCWFVHVDDSLDECYLLRECVRSSGLPFRLDQFESGSALVGFVRDIGETRGPQPDFVLLDYMLQGTTAPEVIRELRKVSGGELLPIIVYTSSEYHADARRSYAAGANYFVTKSVKFSGVRILLNTLYKCATADPADYRRVGELAEYISMERCRASDAMLWGRAPW